MFDRNGEPTAMHCPAIVCDACNEVISGGGQIGHVLWWWRYRDGRYQAGNKECSPIYFVHNGLNPSCDAILSRRIEKVYRYQDGWHDAWNPLDEFLPHLEYNYDNPFDEDQNARYFQPRVMLDGG
jgi:hypothetical protein